MTEKLLADSLVPSALSLFLRSTSSLSALAAMETGIESSFQSVSSMVN